MNVQELKQQLRKTKDEAAQVRLRSQLDRIKQQIKLEEQRRAEKVLRKEQRASEKASVAGELNVRVLSRLWLKRTGVPEGAVQSNGGRLRMHLQGGQFLVCVLPRFGVRVADNSLQEAEGRQMKANHHAALSALLLCLLPPPYLRAGHLVCRPLTLMQAYSVCACAGKKVGPPS